MTHKREEEKTDRRIKTRRANIKVKHIFFSSIKKIRLERSVLKTQKNKQKTKFGRKSFYLTDSNT